ncbi:alpha/beta fold hydrolase [Azonexus sp.]|jgi:pimeloyl-[acyl-carrier protein] methyl ester esterase|uniref:alpha/beta fold hydrolase n=1 Tax=Azonexus sp. TaxID=1872668 RepID=UPI00281CCE05|nr:alpha/beta fold hydrolase [Azonexus sp.]MDR1996326.1 alpha/beta fold hydrolase [Azonexus sp.]
MRPLYILPGWGLGRGPLQAAATALGGTFIDLPGYGETPLEADFDRAAAGIADRLPPGATLTGWSLGAMLALAIAARAPAKVSKLLLIAGTPSFVQRADWPDAMSPATLSEFTAAIAADPAAMLPRFVGGFNRGDTQAKAVTAEILRLASPLPSGDVLATGLGWLRDVDLRAEAPRVTAPTLLLHGAADPLMPLAAARMLAALIPGARLAVLDDCAHTPFLSRPDDFLDHARAFVHG